MFLFNIENHCRSGIPSTHSSSGRRTFGTLIFLLEDRRRKKVRSVNYNHSIQHVHRVWVEGIASSDCNYYNRKNHSLMIERVGRQRSQISRRMNPCRCFDTVMIFLTVLLLLYCLAFVKKINGENFPTIDVSNITSSEKGETDFGDTIDVDASIDDLHNSTTVVNDTEKRETMETTTTTTDITTVERQQSKYHPLYKMLLLPSAMTTPQRRTMTIRTTMMYQSRLLKRMFQQLHLQHQMINWTFLRFKSRSRECHMMSRQILLMKPLPLMK